MFNHRHWYEYKKQHCVYKLIGCDLPHTYSRCAPFECTIKLATTWNNSHLCAQVPNHTFPHAHTTPTTIIAATTKTDNLRSDAHIYTYVHRDTWNPFSTYSTTACGGTTIMHIMHYTPHISTHIMCMYNISIYIYYMSLYGGKPENVYDVNSERVVPPIIKETLRRHTCRHGLQVSEYEYTANICFGCVGDMYVVER